MTDIIANMTLQKDQFQIFKPALNMRIPADKQIPRLKQKAFSSLLHKTVLG